RRATWLREGLRLKERERHHDLAPAVDMVADANRAAVITRDLGRERQTEPFPVCAAALARPVNVGLEDVGEELRWDTGSVVTDGDSQVLLRAPQMDPDLLTRR